jgi:hypothetical protein
VTPAAIAEGTQASELNAASFRDPSGFVYRRDGVFLRQVNRGYHENYSALLRTGLYSELVEREMLVRHEEVNLGLAATPNAFAVLRPEIVPFISYPYEWSFGQLRDAAILTLDLQLSCLQRNMSLRDASAFNVQFVGAKPLFIDTLSFGRYSEGAPWVAYRQFCQHFLAPLALMARRDVRLGLLHRDYSDGVPLDLASKLLGARSRFSLGLLLHVHLHARAQQRHGVAQAEDSPRLRQMTKRSLVSFIEHLRNQIENLTWNPSRTEWAKYSETHNYSNADFARKRELVSQMIARVDPRMTWDLGANTGEFSRIAADAGSFVVAFDGDPGAVELGYQRTRMAKDARILSLVMDLSNPSPSSGWAGSERMSIADRGPADCLLALALMHHLTLTAHVPLGRFAEYCASVANSAIVEYVPFDDPQAQRLVQSRTEAAAGYTQQDFEAAFQRYFDVVGRESIGNSGRTLYLVRR